MNNQSRHGSGVGDDPSPPDTSGATQSPGGRRGALVLLVALTLGIFAGVVLVVSLRLRAEIRTQITRRDADVLHAVAQMQMESTSTVAPDEMLSLVLNTSRLKGVIGLCLSDGHGKTLAVVPASLVPWPLDATVEARLLGQVPVAKFHESVWLDSLIADPLAAAETEPVPLLEVVTPLHAPGSSHLAGVARYWIDGREIARQFAAMDKDLAVQAGIAFAVGGLIIVIVLCWAFGRLTRANRLLARRGRDLLEANRDLTLMAKASAVGAISAHLLHDLKNPLAGLKALAANGGPTPGFAGSESDTEWQTAAQTAAQMHDMVQEVITLLHEESGTAKYELSATEIADLACTRLRGKADAQQVTLTVVAEPGLALGNRQSNLAILILSNLLTNAVEASPIGGEVSLRLHSHDDVLLAEVADHGSGLPEHVRQNPSAPCVSTKPHGNGLGLALSHQLSRHIDAELKVASTGPDGTRFVLSIPMAS